MEAIGSLDEGDDLDRAINLSLVLITSRNAADGEYPSFSIKYRGAGAFFTPNRFAPRVPRLAERMKGVRLLNLPANDLLEEIVDDDQAVIYCDPPYRDASSYAYAVVKLDRDHTFDLLRSQRGRVAISGYGDEWDDLGWHRHEFETLTMMMPGDQPSPRTEVLWTNYRPDQQITFEGAPGC